MAEPESNFARPLTQGGPLFITADNVDPDLCEPFVDIDEARTIVVPLTGARVACQYVHGGFTATNVRFSLYFPDPADYRGRFFQSTYPLVTDEDAAPDTLGFALAHGAFVVSTNNGGGIQAAGAIAGYRINAAAAKFSRVLAASMYGPDAPTRGYIHGASGGAYQTLGALENTSEVWAGGVPMVPGPPNSIPSFMASAVMARRVLRHRLGAIVDALEPGGSGDPYAGLSDEESAALSEVTRLGFPLRGWWQYETLDNIVIAARKRIAALDALLT